MIVLIPMAMLVVVLLYALHRYNDVKAKFKTALFEFSLDARDKRDAAE